MESSVRRENDAHRVAAEFVRQALSRHPGRIALASSFSAEDVVIAHLMREATDAPRIFAIDTGRLHEETLETASRLEACLDIRIDWHFPRHERVEELLERQGLFGFREDLAARRECCSVRKVEPLGRAVADLDAWITGRRREHGQTREGLPTIESEGPESVVKYNPLAAWTRDDVHDHVARHGLPLNPLLERGFASVGCAPCTRALAPGEPERAGRWWWEEAGHGECGLHRAAPATSEQHS